MVEGVVGSSSWGLVRCIKFAVYGAVCGQIVLILIRKYRFVFIRKLLLSMLTYGAESIIMIQPAMADLYYISSLQHLFSIQTNNFHEDISRTY